MLLEIIRKVEAVLFASSKRLTQSEIAGLVSHKESAVVKALENLKHEYASRDTSIMLQHDDDTWKLSVKHEYMDLVEKLMPSTDLAKPVVETLAILAWKAPVLQSDVIKVRSAAAYDHISELEHLGLIARVKQGRSFVIKLTEKFYEYFDLPEGGFKELVPEPEVEEEKEPEVIESDEDRKKRLMEEIKNNRINPEEIILKDKAYLDDFDSRLKQVKAEEVKRDDFEVIESNDSEQENNEDDISEVESVASVDVRPAEFPVSEDNEDSITPHNFGVEDKKKESGEYNEEGGN